MTGIQTDTISKKTTQVDIDDIGKLMLTAPSELTISSGAITITKSLHYVDTEGDIPSDDLTTINGGAPNQILILMASSDSRTIVVKDGGMLYLSGDFTMDNYSDTIVLLRADLSNVWSELSRSNNGT